MCRQENHALKPTAASAITACPEGPPIEMMLTARPRSAAKCRPMLVTEVWTINPWPVKRRANRAKSRAGKTGAAAIRTQEATSPRQTHRAKILSLVLSIIRPIHIRHMALDTVATA